MEQAQKLFFVNRYIIKIGRYIYHFENFKYAFAPKLIKPADHHWPNQKTTQLCWEK